MKPRFITIALTPIEAIALQRGLGEPLCGDDAVAVAVFGDGRYVAAAKRALGKLRKAQEGR